MNRKDFGIFEEAINLSTAFTFVLRKHATIKEDGTIFLWIDEDDPSYCQIRRIVEKGDNR